MWDCREFVHRMKISPTTRLDSAADRLLSVHPRPRNIRRSHISSSFSVIYVIFSMCHNIRIFILHVKTHNKFWKWIVVAIIHICLSLHLRVTMIIIKVTKTERNKCELFKHLKKHPMTSVLGCSKGG